MITSTDQLSGCWSVSQWRLSDLYRLLSVVTCFLISACEAVCVCVSVRNSERCCWLTVILGPAEGRGSPQRRTGTDVSLTWPLLMTEGRERGLFIIVHTSRLIYKAKFRWFTGKWLFKCIDIWWWWCFCDCVNTCVTLLFLQNHQRPDFFGIFSLAQDSIVACEHSYILQKIQPLTHTVKSEPSTVDGTFGNFFWKACMLSMTGAASVQL